MDHANERCPKHGELGKCEQCEEPGIEEVERWRLLRRELKELQSEALSQDDGTDSIAGGAYHRGAAQALGHAIQRLEHYFETDRDPSSDGLP